MTIKVYNEILKWLTSVLTAFGMSAIVLSVVRPMVLQSGNIDLEIALISLLPLSAGVWTLTNLKDEE